MPRRFRLASHASATYSGRPLTLRVPSGVSGSAEVTGDYLYASPRTRFFGVPGAAFLPSTSGDFDEWRISRTDGYGFIGDPVTVGT